MIDRYTTREMRELWSPQNKTQRWLDVEIAVCDGLEHFGQIPAGTTATIRAGAKFDLARMAELEKETRHDVMAFVKNVAENLGEEGRYVHYGVTSYDIVDTALSLLLRDAADIILAQLREADRGDPQAGARAQRHGDDRAHARHPCRADHLRVQAGDLAGRDEPQRRAAAAGAKAAISVGKISGAVGTHANIGPEVEKYVCTQLGLDVAPISTQIIARDRHAQLMATLAILAASLERFATEIRNLARTEIREVQEYFAAGPEGLLGHAAQAQPLELRDGHRAGARGARQPDPDAGEHGDLARARPDQQQRRAGDPAGHDHAGRLDAEQVHRHSGHADRLPGEHDSATWSMMGGLVCSEQIMLALIATGLSREEAYGVAQRNAAKAWDGAETSAPPSSPIRPCRNA